MGRRRINRTGTRVQATATEGPDPQRGSSSTEFAILFPVLVALLLAGPQLALWYFAQDAAEAAARAGARAGSLDGAPSGTGAQAAEDYLADLGSGTITSYRVEETRDAASVTIHVVADVPNVIPLPGFVPSVDVAVVQGLEQFTNAGTP